MAAYDRDKILRAGRSLYNKAFDATHSEMKELDIWRRSELPAIVLKRYEEEAGEPYVTKEELVKLMKWKLQKGKFRPTLQKLILQNNADVVISASKAAFKVIISDKDSLLDQKEYIALIRKALTTIVQLRGVGPATGSLLLSLLSPVTNLAPPFFSDEAALFVFRELGGNKDGDIKLKYSASEYLNYLRLLHDLNSDFEYDFTNFENGAWALETSRYFEIKEDTSSDEKKPSPVTGKRPQTEETPEEPAKPVKRRKT